MKLLFKQDLFLGLRALGYLLVSILFMLLDSHSRGFQAVHNETSNAITPLEYIIHTPARLLSELSQNFSSHAQLMSDNARLLAENTLLKSQLQALSTLQQENEQLHQLLKSSRKFQGQFVETQLFMLSPSPYLQQIIIDKGKDAGVYEGQPVLDAYGIVGQVIRVSSLTSTVMLITDQRSAIPVQDQQSGYRAMAVGNGPVGTLSLHNVPQTEKIKVGDMMVASALGHRFPLGYPVGYVIKVKREAGAQFSTITLKPVAYLQQSRLFLLYSNAHSTARNTARGVSRR